MELKEFFKLLVKYKHVLVIVPLVTVIISFFLVRNMPNEYVSSSKIATGIIDETRQLLDPVASNIQETKVYGEFSNLMEVMQLKKMIDMVSYRLIIHDLENPQTPFRGLGKYFIHFSESDRVKALAAFRGKLQRLEPLSLADNYEDWLNEFLISKGYDERSIRKGLEVKHGDYSDFISISYTSEKAELSAFVVNTLCQGFITYHTIMVKQNETQAVEYLSKLLDEKRHTLDKATSRLQQYKIANDVLDLEDQSRSTNEQIVTSQDKLLQAQKDMASNKGAIDNIDKQFDPADRKYIEQSMTKINAAIIITQDQLHAMNDNYIHSGFNPKLKASVDSIQNKLVRQLNQSSDQYITDPLVAKQDLLRQKLGLQIAYNMAKYSIESIERQIERLNRNFKRLVPLDATVKTYQFAIEVATKEYQDALNRYNQANLQSKTDTKLIQIELATPERAEPSKKMLLVILSGVISGVFCLVVLFILFYLDDGIKNPVQLSNKTHLPVLGYLSLISGPSIDLRKLWDVEHREKMQQFKDLLRAIRFEIDQELNGEKVLAVTSMKEGEGKTLLAISLAYSYSMINKKVLLIDGNFDNPTISETVHPKMFLEDMFKNSPYNDEPIINTNSVLGNHGEDITLLEISNEKFIRDKFNELKRVYDVIIIEAPALESLNKSKEWLLFANKFIAVFEAGQNVSNGKKQMVKYLQGTDEKFAGWVLNKALYNIKKKRKR